MYLRDCSTGNVKMNSVRARYELRCSGRSLAIDSFKFRIHYNFLIFIKNCSIISGNIVYL